MILEGIVTTTNADGTTNISPMGPIVDSEQFTTFRLRPFNSSRTYHNLKRHPHGVLHVSDDVLLFARTAIGLPVDVKLIPTEDRTGHIIEDCCRWFAFTVDRLDDSTERTTISCRVTGSGRRREFFGFNRAKHAVLEAAILATRVHLLSPDSIRQQYAMLRIPVEKTAGDAEVEAFSLLQQYVEEKLSQAKAPSSTVDS